MSLVHTWAKKVSEMIEGIIIRCTRPRKCALEWHAVKVILIFFCYENFIENSLYACFFYCIIIFERILRVSTRVFFCMLVFIFRPQVLISVGDFTIMTLRRFKLRFFKRAVKPDVCWITLLFITHATKRALHTYNFIDKSASFVYSWNSFACLDNSEFISLFIWPKTLFKF